MSELQVIEPSKDIIYSGFTFTKISVIPIGNPTFEQWLLAWDFANKAETSCNWWLGDLLNIGLETYPVKVQQLLDGYMYETKRKFQYVCKQIPSVRRRTHVPFSIHVEIAPFEPEEQEKLLDVAEREGLTRQELRVYIREITEEMYVWGGKGDLCLNYYDVKEEFEPLYD